MTWAPKSARVCVQAGPATMRVKSTTTRPSRAVGAPSARGERSGSGTLEVMASHSLSLHRFARTLEAVAARSQALTPQTHAWPLQLAGAGQGDAKRDSQSRQSTLWRCCLCGRDFIDGS